MTPTEDIIIRVQWLQFKTGTDESPTMLTIREEHLLGWQGCEPSLLVAYPWQQTVLFVSFHPQSLYVNMTTSEVYDIVIDRVQE